MTTDEYISRFLLFKHPELRHSEKVRRGLRAWVYGMERKHLAGSGVEDEAAKLEARDKADFVWAAYQEIVAEIEAREAESAEHATQAEKDWELGLTASRVKPGRLRGNS